MPRRTIVASEYVVKISRRPRKSLTMAKEPPTLVIAPGFGQAALSREKKEDGRE
jgi:hypothetical protein